LAEENERKWPQKGDFAGRMSFAIGSITGLYKVSPKTRKKKYAMERRTPLDVKKVDTKEFEFPETLFVRDIDNRVFQGIVHQALSQIDDITLVEGNFIDSLLGRSPQESIKGIHIEQDMHNNTIKVKVAVNVRYGVPIPEKAEKIQSAITEAITKMTGLHVASVHVVFKNIFTETSLGSMPIPTDFAAGNSTSASSEYSDEL
jgi:uncharacterized alkaline shock family protein YloU